MIWSGLPIVIFGSGGISKEIYYLIREINQSNNIDVFNFLGFVENQSSEIGKEVINLYKVISSDDLFEEYAKKWDVLGVVIPQGDPKIKEIIFRKIQHIKNIVYPNVIHPNVTLDKDSVTLGIGNLLTSGVRLTCNINIGDFNLINLNCTIGHDVKIKNYNVINPGVAISGNVQIENNCMVGTGANILQGISINDNAIVGAGAVVTKNVEKEKTVVGVPAKSII